MAGLNVNIPKTIKIFDYAMRKKMLVKSVFYKRIFGGKGLEFDSYRGYSPNDDSSLIDWKATMKNNGEPLVKQYVEERDLSIFFLIDVGDNMVLGSGEKLKNEVVAEIASSLAHLVLVAGDKAGFALYSDRTISIKKPASGINQFYSFVKEITNVKNYGGKSDLAKALKFIRPYLKDVSAVFIISDFLRINDECLNELKKFMFMKESIGLMVRDINDDQILDLDAEIVVEDIDTGEQRIINPSLIKQEYEKNSSEQKQKVFDIFKKTGSDIVEFYTNTDFIAPLSNFLKKRIKSRVTSKRR
jgi:uncharacterized protein (DUF58 family)